jgi:hypothetical protein
MAAPVNSRFRLSGPAQAHGLFHPPYQFTEPLSSFPGERAYSDAMQERKRGTSCSIASISNAEARSGGLSGERQDFISSVN